MIVYIEKKIVGNFTVDDNEWILFHEKSSPEMIWCECSFLYIYIELDSFLCSLMDKNMMIYESW